LEKFAVGSYKKIAGVRARALIRCPVGNSRRKLDRLSVSSSAWMPSRYMRRATLPRNPHSGSITTVSYTFHTGEANGWVRYPIKQRAAERTRSEAQEAGQGRKACEEGQSSEEGKLASPLIKSLRLSWRSSSCRAGASRSRINDRNRVHAPLVTEGVGSPSYVEQLSSVTEVSAEVVFTPELRL
jgi:hypothetical protein